MQQKSWVEQQTFEKEKKCEDEREEERKYAEQTLSAMDVLAPTSMKNAAKCDTSCELQNQRVIKTLNAPCTSFGEYVCWSVYSSPPQIDSSNCADDRILRN